MRTLAVALLLVLAGCGGGSGADRPQVKVTTVATKAPAKPTVAPPSGTPVPEALSRFRCFLGPKDTWSATGYLTNQRKAKITFQVTVYIGEAAGGEEKAKTRQVPSVAKGGSARFAITRIPAPKAGGPCHVQVLAQR